MGLFNRRKKQKKTVEKYSNVMYSDFYKKPTDQGYFDLRIPDVNNESLALSSVRAFRFEIDTKNRYYIDEVNRNYIINCVHTVIGTAFPQMNPNDFLFEFEDRKIQKSEVNYGFKHVLTENNKICWMSDTRFTPTGKVSKNAYGLNYNVGSKSNQEYTIYGDIDLQADGSINKARCMLNAKDLTVKQLKNTPNGLIITAVTINGESAMNT